MGLFMTRFVVFFLIIFAPLAFGTKEPWSYAIMEILISLGLIAFALSLIRKHTNFHRTPGFWFLILFQVYILLQIIPLPCQMIAFLSPKAFAIHSAIDEITQTQRSWLPLSVNPFATLFQFFRYGSYAAFYIISVHILTKKKTLRNIVITIIIFGGVFAFSSILQLYLAKDMALWIRYTPINSMVMGSYANHNHYAGLMEMIFPIVLGMFLYYRPKIQGTSLFRSITEMLSQEKANIHILMGFAAILIFVSIFLSLSRGGLISSCVSLIAFALLLTQKSSKKKSSPLIIICILCIFISLNWFGWDQVINRFSLLSDSTQVARDGRLQFWKDSKNIIKDFPLTGAGMGCFSHIYPPYKSLKDGIKLQHAHNDYLQLLVEGGIIGFSIITMFILSLIMKTYGHFRKRKDGFSIYLYVGSLTGMIAIFCHSLTDFNLQVGANGLWFYFLAAMTVSAANTNMHGHKSPTRLPLLSSPVQTSIFVTIAGIFSLCTIGFQLSHLASRMYFSHIEDQTITRDTSFAKLIAMKKIAQISSKLNPIWAPAYYSNALISVWKQEPAKAKELFTSCLQLDPLNSKYLSKFANLAPRMTFNNSSPIKGKAYELAARYTPTLPIYTVQYGTWLLNNGKILSGLEQMKKALGLKESDAEKVIQAMLLANVNSKEMYQAFPDKPRALLTFANFLYTIGMKENSEQIYIKILDMMKVSLDQDYWLYDALYYFFKRTDRPSYAIESLITGEKALPKNTRIKMLLADSYRKQGILFRAREKYQEVLLLDPKNNWAKKHLQDIDNQESGFNR